MRFELNVEGKSIPSESDIMIFLESVKFLLKNPQEVKDSHGYLILTCNDDPKRSIDLLVDKWGVKAFIRNKQPTTLWKA